MSIFKCTLAPMDKKNYYAHNNVKIQEKLINNLSNFSGNKALLVMQECIQLVSRNCQGTFFLFDGKKRNKTAGNFRTFLKRGFCPIVMCPPKPQKLGQLKIAEDISHHKLSCNVIYYVCSK